MVVDLSVARPYIESLYVDIMTVTEYVESTDPDTHITTHQEVVVHENVPCKLSFNRLKQTAGDGVVSSLSFLATILTSPDLEIKEGSKIVIVKNGKTYNLSNSGVPRMGINHQEIDVKEFQGWV